MPRKANCVIYGCQSSWRNHKGFFRFPPPDNPMHELWMSKCADSAELILKLNKPFVCSKHFLKEDFRGRRLASASVPELFLEASPEFREQERARLTEKAKQDRIKKLVEDTIVEWAKRVMALPQKSRTSLSETEMMQRAKKARNLLGANLFLRTEVHWVRKLRISYLDNLKEEDYAGREGKSLEVKDIILELSPSEKILTGEEMAAMWKEEKVRRMEHLKRIRVNNVKKRAEMELKKKLKKTSSAESEISECCEIKSEEDSIEMSLNTEDGSMECDPAEAFLESYEQALEYLKPLEDFALRQENYRLIGLLTTMETVMKDPMKGLRP